MITIISASNRKGNMTQFFANYCKNQLEERGEEVKLFCLDELPNRIDLDEVYNYEHSIFTEIAQHYIIPCDKLFFVVPEYNGSIPGILKLFMDAIKPEFYAGKKAALLGIAAGRAGNLRGMDHLTDILHYLQVEVMALKLPVSKIYDILGEQGVVEDKNTQEAINQQLEKFINY
ncbi:NAD(P)H-dependent oxidoreductase [bacterium]|nr:NAD(P)H-dependent oxidoreductase [bacterium]